MARVASTQAEVLEAIVERLISQIEQLADNTCFLSLTPEPPVNVSQNLFVTVAPLAGTFGEGEFEGGGENVTFERAGVVVTIFSAIKLDRVAHAAEILLDKNRGLLEWKRKILRTLAGHDPTVEGGDETLTELVTPLDSSPITYDGKHARLMLTFSTDIDWDLTS